MVIYFNLDHNSHSYYIFIYIWNHQLQQPCFIYNLNMVVVLQCKIHQSFFKLFWVFPWQCCDDKSKKAQWKGTEMLTLLSSLNCWSPPKIYAHTFQAISIIRLVSEEDWTPKGCCEISGRSPMTFSTYCAVEGRKINTKHESMGMRNLE